MADRAELITAQNAAYEESLREDRLRAAAPSAPSEDIADRLRSAMRTDEVVELTGDFLSAATNSFDDGRLIGEGAFGKVYEGIHQGVSQRFAVKKLDASVGGGPERANKDFAKEIEVLRRFRHPHIIRLHGFSRDQHCLVYELGSQGSLADVLVNDQKSADLTWKLRVRIATGIAKALNYLHRHGELPVFHRDVKSSNAVLCNSGMTVKLIDCGLSMLLNEEQVQTQQTIFTVTQGAALGTPGYMCPQFTRTRKYGEKSEVYSFGVVLLELLTGKVQMVDEVSTPRCISYLSSALTLSHPLTRSLMHTLILKYTHTIFHYQVDLIDLYEDDEAAVLLAALDARSGGWDQQVAAELADIALLCIAKHKRRPTMMPVLHRLSALEKKFCQPTLEEMRLDTLADTQRAELDMLRLQAQVTEMKVASVMRTCILCYDDAGQSEGVACAQEHFVCNGCFGNYVKTEAEQAQEHPDLLRQRNGKVCCPDGRHQPAYTEQQIARHVGDEVYALHDQARQQVVRQEEFEAAQAQMQVEVRRMADQIRRSGDANVGPSPEVLARQLQQQMPNARMCGQCSFGPVDHQACGDLAAHHGERRGNGRISNACARCGWFSREVRDWPRWDGRLPDEVHQQHQEGAQQAADALAATLETATMAVRPGQPRQAPRASQAAGIAQGNGQAYAKR
jgi:interleukin-1 receptor-associated kinase 4